MNQRRPNL